MCLNHYQNIDVLGHTLNLWMLAYLPTLFSVSFDVSIPSQSLFQKYELLGATPDINSLACPLDVNQHTGSLNNNSSNICNSIAPLKVIKQA